MQHMGKGTLMKIITFQNKSNVARGKLGLEQERGVVD
jgi:hypothetical protein